MLVHRSSPIFVDLEPNRDPSSDGGSHVEHTSSSKISTCRIVPIGGTDPIRYQTDMNSFLIGRINLSLICERIPYNVM